MQRFSSLTLFFCVTLFLISPTYSSNLEFVWEMPNQFKNPESVAYDPAREVIYISNVNGEPTDKDGNGFISIINLEGQLTQSQWLSGLDAPKGMAIVGDKLYVSDITALLEISIDSGQINKRFEAPGAEFLNDVTADDNGAVYVSDMMTDTIYRLFEGELTVWIHDERLESPNGLYIDGNRMIVASWGKMEPDFSTEVPGRLLQVDIATKAVSNLGNGKPIGNLDGLEPDGKGSYYVTDWVAGKLFRINNKGHAKKLMKMCRGIADLEFIAEKQLLIIPIMNEHAVVAFKATK